MKDKPKEKMEEQKKPYTKPEVKKVTLAPEEAVLGSCKVNGASGPAAPSNCLSGFQCYTRVS